MKANEFVKMVGWEEARGILEAESFTYRQLGLFSYINHDLDNLKRLVESHALVEKHGGLISARKYIKFLRSSVDIGLYHGLDDVDYKTEIPLIEQAIADVESCQ